MTRSVESIGTQTLADLDSRPPPSLFFPWSHGREEEEVLALVSPPPQGDSTNNVTPNQMTIPWRGAGLLDNWPPLQKPLATLHPPPNSPNTTPLPPISTITKRGVLDLI